jgi:Na+-translocating ferredoxin:NAD+ oxidoreductase RNF subunit RnfB
LDRGGVIVYDRDACGLTRCVPYAHSIRRKGADLNEHEPKHNQKRQKKRQLYRRLTVL